MLNIDNAHFIGIGGIGMSSLARILLNMGKKVSGSDIKESNITNILRKEGAKVYIGHNKENLTDAKIVVVSTAIKEDNPELLKAKELGIPILHRSEVLNFLLKKFNKSIAITGTHGKTSTTALISMIFNEANLAPTVSIGGELIQFNSNGILGNSDFLIAEVDESDKSLENLTADLLVITNIEQEHLEHYKSLDEIINSMKKFVNNLKQNSSLIVCLDDNGIKQLISTIDKNIITYSILTDSDIKAENINLQRDGSTFNVYYKGANLGKFFIPVPGIHNISNSLAAIGTALEFDINIDIIKKALHNYKGVKRRFQLIGEYNGITVIDDYAHHPSEIKATLSAAKLQNRNIIAIFQPHRYSRTYNLWQEFVQSFKDADTIIITDIYSASEKNIYNINANDLAKDIKNISPNKAVYYFNDFEQIIDFVVKIAKTGDLIFTLGAGDITYLGPKLLKKLQGN